MKIFSWGTRNNKIKKAIKITQIALKLLHKKQRLRKKKKKKIRDIGRSTGRKPLSENEENNEHISQINI